jgi:hypothetical protein
MEHEQETDELTELRKKVRALQAQLRAKRKAAKQEGKPADELKNLSDTLSDAARHGRDEAARFVRGCALAYFEGMRLASDSLTSMAQEISDSFEGEEGESAADILGRLPSHVSAGYTKAVEAYIGAPRKIVDRFYEAYSSGESE